MKFNCTKCGACCHNVGSTQKMLLEKLERKEPINHPGYERILDFPYGFKEDGSTCEKYDPEIGCTIYENRPVICQTQKMAPIYMSHFGWTEAEYYRQQAKNCNMMIIEQDIPFEYLIPPGFETLP